MSALTNFPLAHTASSSLQCRMLWAASWRCFCRSFTDWCLRSDVVSKSGLQAAAANDSANALRQGPGDGMSRKQKKAAATKARASDESVASQTKARAAAEPVMSQTESGPGGSAQPAQWLSGH